MTDVDNAIDDLEEIAEGYDLEEEEWESVDDASDYLFEHKVKKSWQDVLKGLAMSGHAKKYVEELMSDGKKRTAREIIEGLWAIVEDKRKFSRSGGLGATLIPTELELIRYLNVNNYNKIIINSHTGKEIKVKKKPYHQIQYWGE